MLFSGNALQPVDANGRTVLPPFVVKALERRCGGSRLVFGPHENDPCISSYDEAHEAQLLEDVQRRRLRDEQQGMPARGHHARARRVFGAAERSAFDERGRVTLPPMSRRRARIGARALFVGAGDSFEIWDPDTARQVGDDALRELAEFALGAAQARESEVER